MACQPLNGYFMPREQRITFIVHLYIHCLCHKKVFFYK